MAVGISVAEHKRGRRSVDHGLPLVPFIDFMICLIAFLMVTAVWTQLSRINATGRAPGLDAGPPHAVQKELHVVATAADFDLRWQQGATVLDTQRVPRTPLLVKGEPRYPALQEAITLQWNAQGQHRQAGDVQLDRAVLHVPNDAPFAEIVAVLDALHAPRRGQRSAFDVALATN